jgi:hypothetical protein
VNGNLLRRVFAPVVLALVTACAASSVRAQVAPLGYSPGWNLVGGPAGMDFSSAEGLFVYRDGAYAPAGAATASACAGYWAYFPTFSTLNLPFTADAARTCSLQAGWTLVGDPFDDPAALPFGTVAFAWDPAAQGYTPATMIPAGRAVWVWSPSGGSISLTSVAAGGVTVRAPPPPAQPVQLHVGQYLTVLVPNGSAGPTFVAHTAVPHLQFVDGNPVPGTSDYAYRWQAVSLGEGDITLDPACLAAGCAQPSFVLRVAVT